MNMYIYKGVVIQLGGIPEGGSPALSFHMFWPWHTLARPCQTQSCKSSSEKVAAAHHFWASVNKNR